MLIFFVLSFVPRLVFLVKLGQRKLPGAANDMINWLRWRVTYISPRVSLSFWREIDVPHSAAPPSLPNRGLSAESGGPSGMGPKYRGGCPRSTPGGRDGDEAADTLVAKRKLSGLK